MKWRRVDAGLYTTHPDKLPITNVISRCASGWWWWDVWNPYMRDWVSGRDFLLRSAKISAENALARRGKR